ncbi:MAG: GNAT family N-acetyltransferase [Candidatus Limnocylindria bacterium]
MRPQELEIVHAIETSMFDLALPGEVEPTAFPRMIGRQSSVSHDFANRVGMARLDARGADAAIAEVRDHFGRRRLEFGWAVGPSSSPDDLRERLERAGLQRRVQLAGMALDALSARDVDVRGIHVRESRIDEHATIARLIARTFEWPADVCEIFARAYERSRAAGRLHAYLAEIGGEPIAFAYLAPTEHPRIALLGGAGTMAAHRGRGVYLTLLERRIADAAALGYGVVITQAIRETSAPLAAKRGFRELCVVDVYRWRPDAAG